MLESADRGSLEDAQAAVEVASGKPEAPEASQPAVEGEKFPLADAGEYYTGMWGDYPNFGCPYCMFATLDGNGAVELHILERVDQGNEAHMKALEAKA